MADPGRNKNGRTVIDEKRPGEAVEKYGGMLLKNKKAVIFGAIGGVVARDLAREGAKLFLNGRDAAPVEAAVASSTTQPAKAHLKRTIARENG